jgi:hypothetical protein
MREANEIPASGSVNFYLSMKDAPSTRNSTVRISLFLYMPYPLLGKRDLDLTWTTMAILHMMALVLIGSEDQALPLGQLFGGDFLTGTLR